MDPTPGGTITLPSEAEPLDYFYQLFPSDIWATMETATNNYVPIYEAKRQKCNKTKGGKRSATGNGDDWTDTEYRYITEHDLKAYIGVRMVAALDSKPAIEDYFSTDPAPGNEYIKQTMSRRRFLNITRYFHINDPEQFAHAESPCSLCQIRLKGKYSVKWLLPLD